MLIFMGLPSFNTVLYNAQCCSVPGKQTKVVDEHFNTECLISDNIVCAPSLYMLLKIDRHGQIIANFVMSFNGYS